MSIFLTIAVLSFLLQFSKSFVNILVQLILRISKPTQIELELNTKLAKARQDVKKYEWPCEDDSRYVWTIRWLRAQKHVKDLEEEINNFHNSQRLKVVYVDFIANYALKILLSVLLAIITFRHRYTPVLVYADHINLQPVQGLLSFPTGIPNAISVLMWLFSCNTSFHLLSRTQFRIST